MGGATEVFNRHQFNEVFNLVGYVDLINIDPYMEQEVVLVIYTN